jgi:hypothetical protein
VAGSARNTQTQQLSSAPQPFFTPFDERIVLEQFEANIIQFGLFGAPGAWNQGQIGGKEGFLRIVPICYLN